MRKKKMVYRKSVPLISLVFVIIVSGACLTFISKAESTDLGFDKMKYITAVLAGGGEEYEVKDSNEAPEVTRSNYESREENTDKGSGKIAAMFINSVLSDGKNDKAVSAETKEGSVVSSEVAEQVKKETVEPAVSDIQGAVFIYHTHSTESYEPYSDGNYHITGNEGTVRNVADELEGALKAKGISVYHDKTLHDSPTYTNSYGRSLQTAKNYLAQYPDIKVMIDLHRDAMAPSGKKYSTVTVNGQAASSFNIVVGKQNDNYTQLMAFAEKVLTKANELYPGLGGRIIEREYKFNEYLSDYYLLLEVGNNGNTIDETKNTGKLLADVMEAVMKEI